MGIRHSVLIYNHATESILHEIQLPEDCGRAFDLSHDGQLLATGYWDRKGVDIWQIHDAKIVSTFGPAEVSRVVFDRTGSKLIVQSERGTRIFTTNPSHESVTISNAGDVENGCFVKDTNQYLMPSRRRGILLKCDLTTPNVADVPIPISRTVHCIKHAPNRANLFVIDTARTIWCFDSSFETLLWKTTIKPIPVRSGICVGVYSGDGDLIGITISRFDGFDAVVLNARTGAELHRMENTPCDGFPFRDDSVLLESGKLLNLRSKCVSEGISKNAE